MPFGIYNMPTFTKLAASDGDIDTSDSLMMFEGFQKIFVTNGSNLKVVDFINTKLTHTALATAHSKGDILTQAVTGAVMIVDFTNTAKTETYGYVKTGTFTATANNITGSGSGTTFQATAVTSNPHWYDWTIYPGGDSGEMPAKAYIGCLYRGRCVLSGNPEEPYMWYMSAQANPWNWVYAANSSLSAVAGQSASAGKMGDIVKALIPYRDDYLLIGCSNSLWVIKGDPAEGGVQQLVDGTKGVFGPKSWSFDHEGNLYFASLTGIYMLPVGFGPVQDLSLLVLPHFEEDEELDPAIHRITLEFDRGRHGLLIGITKLTDGTNSNYWYDLKTNGFFPESYDSTCGIYSSHFYESTDDSERALILGCTDGYIRYFNDTSKNDTTTASTATIDSHVVLPIIQSEDDEMDVKINTTMVTAAGGASGGTEGDTDSVNLEYYTAKSTEKVMEDIKDGDTPLHTITISLTSDTKPIKIRNRIKGHSVAIRLRNSTASETWAIECVSINSEDVKRG